MSPHLTDRRAILRAGAFAAAALLAIGSAAAEPPALLFEEAELREGMMTALAVADGIRTQGRILYVALAETARLRRTIAQLDPTDPKLRSYTERLDKLVRRQSAMANEIQADFETYVAIVQEIAPTVRPRLKRTGEAVARKLAELGITRLQELQPILQSHVEEVNRTDVLTPSMTRRWLEQIDDSRNDRDEDFEAERLRSREAEPKAEEHL